MKTSKHGNQRWGQFPFYYALDFPSKALAREFHTWVEEELKGDYKLGEHNLRTGTIKMIHIEQQKDAVLLKLTWGSYDL